MAFKWENINKHAAQIVENIPIESIDVYLFLSDEFQKGDVCKNYLFQFVFRSFYRIDNAGLTSEFKERYFDLMEEARTSGKLDFRYLLEALFQLPNRKGNNTLQFSFITKLANTVNDSYPIFDSEIGGLYGFARPHNYKEFDVRLGEYLTFYSRLRADYEDVLRNNLLDSAIEKFSSAFPERVTAIPEIKKLDFLLWSAGKLKREKGIKI